MNKQILTGLICGVSLIAGLFLGLYLGGNNTAQELGGISDARPARLTTLKYLQVENDMQIDGDLALTGDLTSSGSISSLQAYSNLSTAVTTTTLATTDTGKVYNITSSTNFVLPATSTSAGVYYRFVIGGAITSDVTVQTSDGGNDIEGAMIVAGAVVDCDAEDTITFVSDGENIGDFFEIYSNGTDWLIGASGALTGSKLTCSTST